MKINVNIGEKFEIDGYEGKEEVTLEKVETYKGKKVYIFKNSDGYLGVTYEHQENEETDYDFMEEIFDKYCY